MIDIGVNLTNNRFDKDRDDVVLRAKNNQLLAMIVTGTNVEESQKALALCQQHSDYLFCTAGVHPHDADNVTENYLADLLTLSQQPQVKAIGECGLDFNRNFSTPENQQRVFSEQIQLAIQTQLPLFLHQRDAFNPWFNLLAPHIHQLPAMITHCFTGTKQELSRCLDAGMYIGITGWVCDERRGQALQELIKYIPLDRLLIETDAPYLTPRTIRPKPKSSRNEPSHLSYIVEKIAELSSYSVTEIIEQSTQNAQYVFKLTKNN